MGSFILELGLLVGLGINPNYTHSNTQIPYFLMEKTFDNGIYGKLYNEDRTENFETKEARGMYELGYKMEHFQIGLGHNEQHETNSIEGFNKSYDYIKISYRIELK